MTKDYNDGAWHGWNGGECPVHPKTFVDYIWVSKCNEPSSKLITNRPAGRLLFEGNEHGDLVAFRVVKEPREVYKACGLYFPTRELAEEYVGKYTWSPSIDTTIKTYREVLD